MRDKAGAGSLVVSFVMMVAALNGCSDDKVSESDTVSADLQCAGAGSSLFEADLDGPGAETPAAAIAEVLDPYISQFGGEVVEVRPAAHAVVIDGRRVVVVEAHESPTSGFWADTVYACDSYWYTEQGPPQTEPPVASP